jgi:tripartite-type tricarboxylate transporter receptor subunit TctC
MRKRLLFVLTAALCITFVAGQALSADQFFAGKTMRILVGSSPGGGYDAYSRALARHWGRYVPGHPTIIVENMLGAGGLVCGNYVYKVAKPDGLTLGKFNGGFFFGQALQQPGIEFDARKFIFIGAVVMEDTIVYFTEKSGITSFEKWLTASPTPKLGGDSPGAFAPDGVIRVLASALKVPVQLVSGYKGQGPIRLAMDSGELAGTSAAWYSIRHARSESFKKGELIAVVSNVPKPFADLPNVPTAISLAKSEEGRKLIESYIHTNRVFARPFVLPPGVPADRVQTLRDAFVRTLQDKEFLVEMEKAKLTVDPVSHQKLTQAVAGIFKTDPALLTKLKTILYR